ncbi:PREDICTED: uncharacterized protein LOC104602770 [Nelumbo nucifera]|nr:PREDICTED: uncharacterized protein LOC104602770 [Nelumbo nucifera]
MYPKVKVRNSEQEKKLIEQEERSLLLLKVLESLSLQENPSVPSIINSGKDSGNDLPTLIAKIPKSYIPKSATASISASKEEHKDMKGIEEDKPNIRASAVPRPRAVLSSPDNDGMIGHRNRLPSERTSILKRHNLGQDASPQSNFRCIRSASPISTRRGTKETTDNMVKTESPANVRRGAKEATINNVKVDSSMITRRGSKEATDAKNHFSGKKGPEPTIPKQNGYLRKGKPSSIGT